MTFEEFEKHVESLINPELTPQEVVTMAAMGLTGELGELVDPLKKLFFHKTLVDPLKLGFELGDLLWYVAAMRIGLHRMFGDTFPESLELVAMMNKDKLMARYPMGFAYGGGQR